MDQTKIQTILGKLKSVPGFNPGSLSDEFLVQLVYPLFQKPKMSKDEALEVTRITLGIKDPKEKTYQINKEDKDILLKITGNDAIYGNNDSDADKLNSSKSGNGSDGANGSLVGNKYNPGLNDRDIDDYLSRYDANNNDRVRRNRFIIDPPDLLRKRGFEYSLTPEEIIRRGFKVEGCGDEYNYWGNKSGINGSSGFNNYLLGRDKNRPLDYDEYDDYSRNSSKEPNYSKKAKNVQRTEDERLIQKKLKQDLKNKLGELMAISNSTKDELTRIVSTSAPGILGTIASISVQVGSLAANPYTSAAAMPTLKAGLKGIKDTVTSILTELDTIKGLGIQFMSGIYELGNGPELNNLFFPVVSMFETLDAIYSLFGGGKKGGSAIQNCEEGESNKLKRIFMFDFTKPLPDYDPGGDCKLSTDKIVGYETKVNKSMKVNANGSLTFDGILKYNNKITVSGIKNETEFNVSQPLTIGVYNDDGTLKREYKYEWVLKGYETTYTRIDTDNSKNPPEQIPHSGIPVTVYSFDLKSDQEPTDFKLIYDSQISTYNEQEEYKGEEGKPKCGHTCTATIYIIDGNNIKVNGKNFNTFSYTKQCDMAYQVSDWNRVESTEYKHKSKNEYYYNKIKDSDYDENDELKSDINNKRVELRIENVSSIMLVNGKTKIIGGSVNGGIVASYSLYNIFGDSVNIEVDRNGNEIKKQKCYDIQSLNSGGGYSQGMNIPYDEKNYAVCDCTDPLKAYENNTNFTENDEGEKYYSFEVKDNAMYINLVNLNEISLEKIEIENYQDISFS